MEVCDKNSKLEGNFRVMTERIILSIGERYGTSVNKSSFTFPGIHAIDATYKLPYMNTMKLNLARNAALLASLDNQSKSTLWCIEEWSRELVGSTLSIEICWSSRRCTWPSTPFSRSGSLIWFVSLVCPLAW
jgi:hypothetical protein